MQAQIRQQPHALLLWARNGAKRLASGLLLFVAGVAAAVPAASHAATAPGAGRIVFAGAVTVGTCEVPTAGPAVRAPAFSSARMECSDSISGSRAVYHVVAEAIPDRSGVRLLEYAREKYRDALLVTYNYD